MTPPPYPPPVGVLLAGGLARRIGGGDKPLRLLAGKPLLDHAIARAAPQCWALVLNANGPAERFAAWNLPVVPDSIPGFPGPLAGILAGMRWAAAHHPGAADILSIPADTPFLPPDLAATLAEARARAGVAIACALSGERQHPAVALWPVALADALEAALLAGTRKVKDWAELQGATAVPFAIAPYDPFFNVNTADDLAEAHRLLPLVG